MNLWQKILALFGAQFVMQRTSNRLTFEIKRAYLIGGRYYLQSHSILDLSHDGSAGPYPERQSWLMLTAGTRLRHPISVAPHMQLTDYSMWIPLTNLVDAHVSLLDEGQEQSQTEALSSAATGDVQRDVQTK